jgi:LPXTG-motif cell wall-anchored protein
VALPATGSEVSPIGAILAGAMIGAGAAMLWRARVARRHDLL